MRRINIALLGFGTVGQGVWNLLKENAEQIKEAHQVEFSIKKILVPTLDKDRGIAEAKAFFTTDFSDIENDKEIDVVVELIGKADKTLEYMERSIKAGKHLVSANKHILARHGLDLYKLADKKEKMIRFEASVCGAIPIVNLVTESMSVNKINKVMGIMNGTSNFILSKMDKEGSSYEDVLKEAQELGYAESDPTDDVKGFDAANKIAILASLAFNSSFDINKVLIKGIDEITKDDFDRANKENCTIKLIAGAEKTADGVAISVKPCFVKRDHPLAAVGDAFNAVFLDTNCAGDMSIMGRGAGSLPTASAVVGDLIDISLKKDGKADYSLSERLSHNIKQVDMSGVEIKNFEVIE